MDHSSRRTDVQQTAGLLGDLLRQARLVWRLLHDGRVSGWAKLLPFAGLVYLLSPIDLLPDFMIPGLSQLDDLAVILLSLKMFVEFCPPGIVREHLEQLTGSSSDTTPSQKPPSGPTIDAPYRVLDRENE
jgi:uncharacterized membrane protein YkvA (DUF1232 family)